MPNPLVSVIIPTHNRPLQVVQAVQSVFNQSFQNFEVIVVDDGSTVCKSGFNDLPVRYIKQEHLGAPAARNRGIKESKGKYVAFLDDDDTFLPEKLERQVGFMEANPAVGMSYTSFIRRIGNSDEIISSGQSISYPWLLFNCSIAMPTVMVRRECLDELRFNEYVKFTEDIILWSQIARQTKVRGIMEPLSVVNPGIKPRAKRKEVLLASVDEILKYAVKGDPYLNPVIKASLTIFWDWNRWRIEKRHD